MKHVLIYGMTDNPGGIETYLLNFFQRVHGKDVCLGFVSDFPSISGSEILESRNANQHFIPGKRQDLFGHILGMWKILRQHKEYEAVYFNILDAGAVFTMIPCFFLGRKIVVHSHNGSTDKVKLHNLCKPFLNLMTKRRVACSQIAAQHMFGAAGKDALVIPNAIDGKKYAYDPAIRRTKREELHIENNLVVVHVGRISMQKNPLFLIDVFEEIHKKRPDAVLLSIGQGEMMEEFQAYIAQKKLENSVKCLGVRKDVSDILQAADVFLFPSLYEGLPISLIEAQAAGLPCVMSDTISSQTVFADCVKIVSLASTPEEWAQCVLNYAEYDRKNTLADLRKAGFDISCCEEFDKQLIAKF